MRKIILDPGHGGIFNNLSCTAGKRSPEIPPGFFEGFYVRQIVKTLMDTKCKYEFIYPLQDTQLDVAIKCRNLIYNNIDADLVLSLHTNAAGMGSKWKSAHGSVLFYNKHIDKTLAKKYLDEYCLYTFIHNRGISTRKVSSILKCKHPTMLHEMLFHTSKKDVFKSKDRNRIVIGIIEGLDKYFGVNL